MEGTLEVIVRLNLNTGLEQKGDYRDNTWLLLAQIQIKTVLSSITEYDLSFLVSPCKFDWTSCTFIKRSICTCQ